MIRILALITILVTLQWAGEIRHENLSMAKIDLHPKMVEKFAKSMIGIDELNKKLSKSIMKDTENISKDLIVKTRKEFKVKSLGIIFENGLSLHEYKNYTKLFRKDKDFKKQVMMIVEKEYKSK